MIATASLKPHPFDGTAQRIHSKYQSANRHFSLIARVQWRCEDFLPRIL